MIKKIGSDVSISLLVKDELGDRVRDDTPHVNIKDLGTGKYYNGLSWQQLPFNLYMSHVSNGVYTYDWNLIFIGVFEIDAISTAYGTNSSVSVNVYAENESTFPWLITDSHKVQFASNNNAETSNVIIQDSQGYYWDGEFFIPEEVENAMFRESPNDIVFSYQVAFANTGKYIILARNATDDADFLMYSLNVVSESSEIAPIAVSWDTLVSLDGTDCLVVDDNSNPIQGVEVAVYDSVTKVLVNKIDTNADGTWEMILRPGRYTFMFIKGGYEAAGFERVVS